MKPRSQSTSLSCNHKHSITVDYLSHFVHAQIEVSEEYRLHLQWLKHQENKKRVNKGTWYKGQFTQCSQPLEYRPMRGMRSNYILENVLMHWLMSEQPASNVSKTHGFFEGNSEACHAHPLCRLTGGIGMKRRGGRKTMEVPQPSVSICCCVRVLGPVLWGEPHHSIHHGSKSLLLPSSNFHNALVLVLGLKSAGCWDASPNWRERTSFPGWTSVLKAILQFSPICLCYQSPVRIKWPSVHKRNDDDEHMDWPELQSHILLHC